MVHKGDMMETAILVGASILSIMALVIVILSRKRVLPDHACDPEDPSRQGTPKGEMAEEDGGSAASQRGADGSPRMVGEDGGQRPR